MPERNFLDPRRLASLEHYALARLRNKEFAGIAWCMEHQGKVVAEQAVGFADHDLSVNLKPDTLFRVYSMTKPIISVRCLQLVESGLLRLGDPVSRWIPAFASQRVLSKDGKLQPLDRPVTVEDLLTHRAGLSYDFLPDCPVAQHYRDARLAADGARPLSSLVDILAEVPLALQPGQRWYYSYATDVLAQLLVCVCDQPLGDILEEGLFNPLGMHDTGFRVAPAEQVRVAGMFGQRQLGVVDDLSATENRLMAMDVDESYPVSSDTGFERGGIGLFSTSSDYRRFMGVLADGRAPDGRALLSASMVDMLWINRLTPEQMPIDIGGKPFFGYGWGLTGRVMADCSQSLTLSCEGEGGWSGAASTYFWIDRKNDMRGIVMAQYLGSVVPLGADMQTIAYGAMCSVP